MRVELPITPATVPTAPPSFQPKVDGGFGGLLSEALQGVNQQMAAADVEARKVATGQTDDLAAAVMAVEQASLAMEFTVQVRNRLVESFQEVMRMQL